MIFDTLVNNQTIEETTANLTKNGINVSIVDSKEEALEKIKKLIPPGSEIYNGSSTTLEQIGFIKLLKEGKHEWKNLHEEVLKEPDKEKQTELRRKSVTAEYFLASVNAITKTGQLMACDATGSRITAFPFAAKKLILVAGTQKITANLEEAMKRIREYVYPLEDERAKKAYGAPSTIGKCVIIEKEIIKDRITLILVKERLGF